MSQVHGGALPIPPVSARTAAWGCLLATLALAGCVGETPSARVSARLALPAPTAVETVPRDQRLSTVNQGEHYDLAPQTLIPIAFNRQADIKSSFQNFKSEEARYDFFYTSNDSLTPKVALTSTANEYETLDEEYGGKHVERERLHKATVSLEKRFFDTTELDVGLGYDWQDNSDEGYGAQPFVAANVRYPLWASRRRLERTSEEIFRRNELNDAQLAFIKTVRSRLQSALNHYYNAIFNRESRDACTNWREDLEAVLAKLDPSQGEKVGADHGRVQAELATIRSKEAGYNTFVEVQKARLKSACGLPFHAEVELVEAQFDPFHGMTHEALLQLGIQTDPEIATLRNARDNATVQLDLARRGRWDVALLMAGESNLAGRGTGEGVSDWSVSVGLEVAVVDSRVTRSLIRQASADIERYTEAMAARENTIFINTLEPQRRNVQLAQTQQELIDNLPRYQTDYESALAEYLAGRIDIDSLLRRRADLYYQQEEIARQALYMGYNTASLCAETGKFFELLNGHAPAETQPAERGNASAGQPPAPPAPEQT
jgi:outer membrane protein TolC